MPAMQAIVVGPTSLHLAWDIRARMAFFSFYVSGLSRTHGALTSLSEQATPGNHLTDSVDAVSFAFMAHHYRRSGFDKLARAKYLKAIQHLNKILQSPSLAATDTTLQSVLLLDLCEKFANHSSLDPNSWLAHVNGALALVRVRGHRNLSSQTARQLAARLITTSMISCIAASIRVPAPLLDLRRSLDPFFPKTDAKWRMPDIVISLIDLQVDIHEGKLAADADILDAAWALEARFVKFRNELLSFWQPAHIIAPLHNSLILGSYYGLYHDHFVTQGWNVFRTMRMLLHSIIQNYSVGNAGTDHDTSSASRKIMELSSQEICSSAPQFILEEARAENALPFAPLQTLQLYALVPNLYVAGHLSRDPRIRMWVITILKHMAEVGGMEMASRVAGILETSNELPYWTVYAMLGSYAFAT